MDLVLGLSATSTAVRWVLSEGLTGGGAAVDRGALDITDVETFDAEALLTVLLDANEAVVEGGVHAVGVTWTADGDAVANAILAALEARDLNNVVAVSETEAAEALACGIADIAGYEDTAVCIFEPDATLVAVVDPDGVMMTPNSEPPWPRRRQGKAERRANRRMQPVGCGQIPGAIVAPLHGRRVLTEIGDLSLHDFHACGRRRIQQRGVQRSPAHAEPHS